MGQGQYYGEFWKIQENLMGSELYFGLFGAWKIEFKFLDKF